MPSPNAVAIDVCCEADVCCEEGRRLRLPSGHELQVTGKCFQMILGVNSRGKPLNSEG